MATDLTEFYPFSFWSQIPEDIVHVLFFLPNKMLLLLFYVHICYHTSATQMLLPVPIYLDLIPNKWNITFLLIWIWESNVIFCWDHEKVWIITFYFIWTTIQMVLWYHILTHNFEALNIWVNSFIDIVQQFIFHQIWNSYSYLTYLTY